MTGRAGRVKWDIADSGWLDSLELEYVERELGRSGAGGIAYYRELLGMCPRILDMEQYLLVKQQNAVKYIYKSLATVCCIFEKCVDVPTE